MATSWPCISGAEKETSSSRRSRYRMQPARADVLHRSLTSARWRDFLHRIIGKLEMHAFGLEQASYCLISAFFGSVRMRTKSSLPSELSSTRIGKRPETRGSSPTAWPIWNAPGSDKQNMIGACTKPYLVLTVSLRRSARDRAARLGARHPALARTRGRRSCRFHRERRFPTARPGA